MITMKNFMARIWVVELGRDTFESPAIAKGNGQQFERQQVL